MKFSIKQRAEKLAEQFAAGGDKLKHGTLNAVRAIDNHHEHIADHADTVAKAAKVVGGVAAAGAIVAAPTGLTALGVAVGVLSAPAIVTIAPILASAAGIAITVSAGASLYSEIKRKRFTNEGKSDDRQV